MNISTTKLWLGLAIPLLFSLPRTSVAQTDQDAIMMAKNNFCTGLMYTHSSWKDYWEGMYKRDNQNLGTVSTNMYAVMGNYGVTKDLNVLFGLPYVSTNSSAGTLTGQKGLQDLSLWVKWKGLEKKVKKTTYSAYILAGGSIPVSNYVIDYLPLSIGSGSRTLSGRLLLDYQRSHFFVTGSGTYTYRGNVSIDRTAYYTTTLILSNQVEMPDVASYGLRTGYRSDRLIAEAVLTGMNTLGGFDIRRNDMPFPSNKMNVLTLGVNAKYEIPWLTGLAVTGGGNYVLTGRNVGQSTTFNIGVFYVIDFSKKETNPDNIREINPKLKQ